MIYNIRSRFLAALLEQIDSQSLFDPDDRWLLAVSGGPDSMAMLHGLLALQRETDWPGPKYFHVAHLNHQLRGSDSDADAEFVRTEAKIFGLDCTIRATNVDIIAKETGESLETTARHERYKFLARTAVQNECNKIAMAHNADDQAETILHRILRGTGVRGLAGIPAQRKLDEYSPTEKPLIVIRPLLTIPRLDIEDYLKTKSIHYRIDQSNYSVNHTRNRLRHELLPLLQETFNPQVISALNRLGQTAQWIKQLLNQDARTALSELTISRTEHTIVLDLPRLQSKSIIQQTELIRLAMQKLPIGMQSIGFTQIHAILELIASEEGAARPLDLPQRLKVTRKSAQLIMETAYTTQSENWLCFVISLPANGEMPVEESIFAYIDKQALDISYIQTEEDVGGLENLIAFREGKTGREEMIDGGKVKGTLRLRTWREGDRFTPLGAKGEKTLGDFFTDAKIPIEYRKRIGLVCDDAGIVWVTGMRIAERVKITPRTRQILKLKIE